MFFVGYKHQQHGFVVGNPCATDENVAVGFDLQQKAHGTVGVFFREREAATIRMGFVSKACHAPKPVYALDE